MPTLFRPTACGSPLRPPSAGASPNQRQQQLIDPEFNEPNHLCAQKNTTHTRAQTLHTPCTPSVYTPRSHLPTHRPAPPFGFVPNLQTSRGAFERRLNLHRSPSLLHHTPTHTRLCATYIVRLPTFRRPLRALVMLSLTTQLLPSVPAPPAPSARPIPPPPPSHPPPHPPPWVSRGWSRASPPSTG